MLDNITIHGRNLEITPRLREYVEKKVGKLDRYLPTISSARMDLAMENTRSAQHRHIAQLTIWTRGRILRAEERTDDIFASIDAVMDKMYRQIARYKGKRQDRFRAGGELPLPEEYLEELEEEEEEARIVRVKRFEVVPMTEEEAIEQMELLGHDFFVFYNADTESINVLYRRKDGHYGLLQPQMP